MILQYQGDAIEVMKQLIEEGVKVDLILTDPPYGTTNCKWDSIIDLHSMWDCISKIKKSNKVATLLFAQTPFDKVLGTSNIKELKYEWIWEKTQATGHLNSKKMPMKAHENILVFYEKLPKYFPQKTQGHGRKVSSAKNRADCIDRRNIKEDYLYGKEYPDKVVGYDSTERFPRDVLKYPTDKQRKALHPTQKPVSLLEYFLKTYTEEGDWVLDFTSGSGSLGEACLNTNRNYILIEKYDEWIEVSKNRLGESLILGGGN